MFFTRRAGGGGGPPQTEGKKAVVYFTRDLSAEGLKKVYSKINQNLTGKVAVKLHTGEPHGPNILPREWVKELLTQIPNGTLWKPMCFMTARARPPKATAKP